MAVEGTEGAAEAVSTGVVLTEGGGSSFAGSSWEMGSGAHHGKSPEPMLVLVHLGLGFPLLAFSPIGPLLYNLRNRGETWCRLQLR